MKTLFIHRSVGRNLLRDGNVRGLLKNYPDIQLDDYDQNIDKLTTADGSVQKCRFSFPGDDTTPMAYAGIFNESAEKSAALVRDFALQYDKIVVKSCYPNNNIKNEVQLRDIQNHYQSIAAFFVNHTDKQLVILTSPPLTPLRTTPASAKRARELATWFASQNFGSNVSVFDFYDLLADSKHGRLKRIYRRRLPVDSHPNERASREIAPVFVEHISRS